MNVRQQLENVVNYFRVGISKARAMRGTYFSRGLSGKCEGYACAVGTILLGAGAYDGREGVQYPTRQVNEMVPTLKLNCPLLPRCNGTNRLHPLASEAYPNPNEYKKYPSTDLRVGDLAEHLFEDHKWGRKRVANYLEEKVNQLEKKKRVFQSQMKKEEVK